MLKSVDDIVDALGGTAVVAELVGVVPSAVSNWKFRSGLIPSENFFTISEALAKKRLRADPAVFGFKSREAAE